MHTQAAESLVDFLKQKAGPALRVVFQYDPRSKEYELLYLRDDIGRRYDRDDLEEHFDTFRRDAQLGQVQENKLETGTHHCSIRVYDKSLIFNFTHYNLANTIVSLDPDVGRGLLGFIAESLGWTSVQGGKRKSRAGTYGLYAQMCFNNSPPEIPGSQRFSWCSDHLESTSPAPTSPTLGSGSVLD